jgi:hypothetical protein
MNELQKKKINLEKEITEAVGRFQADTGLTVAGLELHEGVKTTGGVSSPRVTARIELRSN